MNLDPRITPARGDIAASHLRGQVDAKRFVTGDMKIITMGRAAMRAGPADNAGMTSELLFGERVVVYERRDGWAWVQAELDRYVGYVSEEALGEAVEPTHRVIATMTPLLPAPDVKRPALDMLPMNAKVHITGHGSRFGRAATRGYVFEDHLAPIRTKQSDWVAVAERFIGVPYIWGGKTVAGMDCSGLVQTALEAAGIPSLRDSDMQQRSLGRTVPPKDLQRGDLIFWNGHVGIMRDAETLLHANAFFMEVTSEPLAIASERIAKSAGAITAVKRL
ncbi:MAG TPA: NlpC/P60 family protein [Rhizomicrobium sp.]